MGLNLAVKNYETDNSKIGIYRSFGTFRKAWAKYLGFDLLEMKGFGGDKEWIDEPLQAFFNHSDCDGEIQVEDCEEILNRAVIDRGKLKDYEYEFDILIEFLGQAISKNEPLEFN